MEDILKELHLESLIPHFLAERIEPANVAALSDEELCRVGVTTIGDRLRLRDLCAVAEKDCTRESVASNVLQERKALFNGRNSRRADRQKKAVAKRSWTVSFVCVADRHQSKIPTSTEKQVLFQAGLYVRSFSATAQRSRRRRRSPIVVTPTRQSSSSDNAATFTGSIRSAKKWGIRDSKCNSFKMSSMIFFPKGKKAKHT